MKKAKTTSLEGKKIVLGITGGIAAYKVPELIRFLIKAKADVRVVMTEAAKQFITPLTLQAISQHIVSSDLFDIAEEAAIGHIELADWADLLIIAPATADVVAKIALGLANDLLTTIYLATKAPVLLAPAMNVNMWNHPATQKNIATLAARGVQFIGPNAGELACGWVGSGRMSEPEEIGHACLRYFAPRDMEGINVLITAGPTLEPLDPVRYISNRSSGKMGYALAEAAIARGAAVTLVSGPTTLPTPNGVKRIDVETAQQMRDAVVSHKKNCHLIALVAAVADYRPDHIADAKLKKSKLGMTPTVNLCQNPDILKEVGEGKGKSGLPFLIGFAAETENIEEQALDKFTRKNCDLMVGNNITEKGSGFNTDTNRVYLLSHSQSAKGKPTGKWLPQMEKKEVANAILDAALESPLLKKPKRTSH